MDVHSYLELTTTLIGWHVGNSIAEILVTSGLVFLPFGIALYRNWAEPLRSQESKSAAYVSLRRMEQDFWIAALILGFCFLPAVPVAPSEIQFSQPYTTTPTNAQTPDLPYSSDSQRLEEILIPLTWWLVYTVSSKFTNSIVAVIDRLHQPSALRWNLLRIAQLSISDSKLITEMGAFRKECYEPSLAKFQRNNQGMEPKGIFAAVDWLGSHFFLNTEGYYKPCTNVSICGSSYHAKTQVPGWQAASGANVVKPGLPYCNAWWIDPQRGLRIKLLQDIHKQAPWFKKNTERLIKSISDNKSAKNSATTVIQFEDRVLRRMINQVPRMMVERADRGDGLFWDSMGWFSIDGIQQFIGSLGALIASGIFHIVMELVVIGLPMTQAIMLMLMYIAIPLLVPYAIINPGILVRIVLLLFSLRFLTALWAMAEFLDEKLLMTMYPDSGLFEFGGGGTTADIVLSLITLFSYLSLPIAWFMLMGTIGSRAIGLLSSGWSAMNSSLESSTKASADIALSTYRRRGV